MREAQSPVSVCASRLMWIMMLVLRRSPQSISFTDGSWIRYCRGWFCSFFFEWLAGRLEKKGGSSAREHFSWSPLSILLFKSKPYKTQSKCECGRERKSGCQLAHISQLELLYTSRWRCVMRNKMFFFHSCFFFSLACDQFVFGGLPPPKNMPIIGLAPRCECVWMVPCSGLASHPGCIPALQPVFLGSALNPPQAWSGQSSY